MQAAGGHLGDGLPQRDGCLGAIIIGMISRRRRALQLYRTVDLPVRWSISEGIYNIYMVWWGPTI